MEIGIRHLHFTVVALLLLFVLFKTVLLVSNKKELLDRIRAKSKVVDIILGVLAISTGAYLMTLKPTVEPYLLVKIVVVLIAIPLGIVGLKRHKKPMAVMSLLLILYVYGIGETQSYKFKKDPFTTETAQPGKEIYQKLCVECHGDDGALGLYKAPNLVASMLTDTEKRTRILQGKGIMRSYQEELNDQQVTDLMHYITTLP